MNRQHAKSIGARFYTGFSCKFGHNGLRYASTGNCVDCMSGGRPTSDVLKTKTFTGLPEDIALLDQLWASILQARRSRLAGAPGPAPATPPATTVDSALLPPKLPGAV